MSHAGIIDKVMYEMLLRADLVIADISTANPNALYELGVRHAPRPFSAIIMKEVDGKFLFELNHLATVQYKHPGEDIGTREATKKRAKLEGLTASVLSRKHLDSPVYTFLQGLQGPTISEREFQASVDDLKCSSDSLSKALDGARRAAAQDQLEEGRRYYELAFAIQRRARNPTPHPIPLSFSSSRSTRTSQRVRLLLPSDCAVQKKRGA